MSGIQQIGLLSDLTLDLDALAYIRRVEGSTGDNQPLEVPVQLAINDFVKGCKADGIWTAIKASCILAGARTLTGALQPLVGTAPTNFNFVSGDYNRKTGLIGNGTTKYLNSNRNNNADPQNSKHLAVYVGETLLTSASFRSQLGVAPTSGQVGASVIGTDATLDSGRYRINGQTPVVIASGLAAGFKGASRSNSSDIITRQSGANATTAAASETPVNVNLTVFARNVLSASVDSYSNGRLAFYSIGESLTLADLDTRVTTLINAYAAVIP